MARQDTVKNAHKMLMASSLRQFTCRMFEHMNKRPYLVGSHHQKIFDALDKLVRGEYNKLIINIAPRYGKTLLVSQMFIAYGLAINPASKFLHLSYSGSLTQDNSIAVRDIINSEYFKAVFDARVQYGRDTKSRWDTIQGGGVYATSTLGQITGFGAGRIESDYEEQLIDEFTARFNSNRFSGAIVIDDPLKPDDALSDNIREQVNRRFETTIRNRVNSRRTPIIVIMQRLHEHDLCGYLQEVEPGEWEVLSLPCIYEDDLGDEQALWSFKHTLEELYKLRDVNPFVFETQYMQNPTPMEGLMYRPFRTYDIIPNNRKNRNCNYTDSADTGADYLCSICYVEAPDFSYVTDILYTKKSMEFTEQALANMLQKNQTDMCHIESNNGGRAYRRNVERLSREGGNYKTSFHDFTQSKNKQVRIYTHSNEVNNMILFPSDWERRWPEYARAMKAYRKEGSNAHDDAPDATTGIVEMRGYGFGVTDEQLLNDFL